MPEIDSHFAGLTMDAKIILQSQGSENFKFAVSINQNISVEN